MFQGNRNAHEDEELPDDAVIVYFWPGKHNSLSSLFGGDKKVDHVSLRTRGARGYDLKVISPQQWESLPNPISEQLDIDERMLRLNLRDRLINIKIAPEGIHYRVDKADGEIVEGAITDTDLELSEMSFASHIQRNTLGTIKWKIVEFLKNRHPESIGETGIYASFYPVTPTKIATKSSKTKSFDLDRMHHNGQFREMLIYGLDIQKIEEKFQNSLEIINTFSFFASTILGRGHAQNCTSLVFNLLQAGGAKLPTMNIVSFDKKVIIYNVTVEMVLQLLNINRQIAHVNNTQNASHTLLGTVISSNGALIFCHRAVLEQFPFLWLKYAYNEKITYSSFIFIAFTFLRLLRERENSNTLVIASSAISFFLFYMAQHFLYERTLSPRDLYELLNENKEQGGYIYQERPNTFDIRLSSENNWAIVNMIFYGIAGAMIYAYAQTGRIEENAPFLSLKFLAEFIPQFIGTRYIHFNPDISLMAMLMSLPLISRLSGAQYIQDERNFGLAGLMASIQYATENFLDSQDFLWAATFANISSHFMREQLNNNAQLLIPENNTQSSWDKNKPYVIMFGATLLSAKLLLNRPIYSGIIMGAALAYYKKHTNNELKLIREEVSQPQWNKLQLCTLLAHFLISNELFHEEYVISAGIVMGAGWGLIKKQSHTNPESGRGEDELSRSTWSKANITTAISVGAALIGAGFLAYKNLPKICTAVSGITHYLGR